MEVYFSFVEAPRDVEMQRKINKSLGTLSYPEIRGDDEVRRVDMGSCRRSMHGHRPGVVFLAVVDVVATATAQAIKPPGRHTTSTSP